MHIQIVNFQLKDITAIDFQKLCDELAPTFAGLDGLISKVWLANEETNTYGGVYLWESREAMDAYKAGEIYASIGANPALVNVTATDFEVIAGPSKVTGVG